MQRLAILILILLAGCVSETLENNTRPALEATVEVSPHKNIEADRVIFIVSDYEKAARTSLAVEESVYLPTQPPVNITVLEANTTAAVFRINGQEERIKRGEAALLNRGALRIELAK